VKGERRLRLVNMNPAAVVGRDELPSRSNYFVGSDPISWHSNVPDSRGVQVRDAFRQWIWGCTAPRCRTGCESTAFVVDPDGNLDSVRVNREGFGGVAADKRGWLRLQTGGTVVQNAPVVHCSRTVRRTAHLITTRPPARVTIEPK
jgi:hypothetical protein